MLDKQLMEAILAKENLTKAYQVVKANGGAPGVDGITVDSIQQFPELYKTKKKVEYFVQSQ